MDNTVLKDYPSASDFDHVDALIHQHSWARDTMKLLYMVYLHTTATSRLSRWHLGERDYHLQMFLERADFQRMCHTPNTADKKMMPLDALYNSPQKYNGDKLSTEEVKTFKTWLKQQAAQPEPSDEMRAEDNIFRGTYHCETLLMSYHL
jgi:hypothetical protein